MQIECLKTKQSQKRACGWHTGDGSIHEVGKQNITPRAGQKLPHGLQANKWPDRCHAAVGLDPGALSASASAWQPLCMPNRGRAVVDMLDILVFKPVCVCGLPA